MRFFSDRENEIPDDSYPVSATLKADRTYICVTITEWLQTHPKGKVDFVTL